LAIKISLTLTVKWKQSSQKSKEKVSQSINSESKSTIHHNFYNFFCCKNNKFELLLQSLFVIINPIKDICFAIFAAGVICFVLFAFGAINSKEYNFR